MDTAAVGRQDGRAQDFREYFDGSGAAGFKKNQLKPWLKQQWCIPPKSNAEFVCAMEDVLEVYQRPQDPKRPLVCMDETSKQHVLETRDVWPAEPGQAERHDYEYQRNGVSELFMILAPLAGCGSERSSGTPGVGVLLEGGLGPLLSRGGEDRGGHGQLKHAWSGLFLRGLFAGRGMALNEPLRIPSHAETRQLVKHGRGRTERPAEAVPASPYRRSAQADGGSRRLGTSAQHGRDQSRLALYDCQCAHQAETLVPDF